jgi:hypothetical protein
MVGGMDAFARMFQIVPPEQLMANSTLVFVGKVQSVETSSIATSLSYPTWEGISFPWLQVNAEVTEPLKGIKKGEIVHVMMLSISNSESHGMINAPDALEPDRGDIFLFCLSPTSVTNSFAALTAPINEFLSIFPLHRAHEAVPGHRSRDWGAKFVLGQESFAPFRNLVNESGETVPNAIAKLRETYARQIRQTPTNNRVLLEWQSHTNTAGWVMDVPKTSKTTNAVPK